MAANFTPTDISNALANSSNPEVKSFAREAEISQGVWKILDTTIAFGGDVVRGGGVINGASASLFLAKKAVAVTDVANQQIDSHGVKIMTLASTYVISTTEIAIAVGEYGSKAAQYSTPTKLGIFITLKSAEVIVSAAGLADISKCKLAIATLLIDGGGVALGCTGTAGALCMLGAATIALDAFNVYEQCRIPPQVSR